MPILSRNKIIGPHKIEGIGDDFIPNIVDKSIIDKIITVEKYIKFNNDSLTNEEKIMMIVEFGNAVKTYILSKPQYDKLQKLISNEK